MWKKTTTISSGCRGQSSPRQPRYVIEICNACRGTGCPACKRKGEVRVPNPPRICRSCNGTGINAYGRPHTVCHGTGWMNGSSF